jgi:hypothetical protein
MILIIVNTLTYHCVAIKQIHYTCSAVQLTVLTFDILLNCQADFKQCVYNRIIADEME